MRVIVDGNLSPRWVGALSDARFEPAHWTKLGHRDASDAAVMELARARNSVVLTADLGVGAILAAVRGGKPSVVRIRAVDRSPDIIGARVVDALHRAEGDLEAGALVTIDLEQDCIRILPLSSDPVGDASPANEEPLSPRNLVS